jgi:hypothetical protein
LSGSFSGTQRPFRTSDAEIDELTTKSDHACWIGSGDIVNLDDWIGRSANNQQAENRSTVLKTVLYCLQRANYDRVALHACEDAQAKVRTFRRPPLIVRPAYSLKCPMVRLVPGEFAAWLRATSFLLTR